MVLLAQRFFTKKRIVFNHVKQNFFILDKKKWVPAQICLFHISYFGKKFILYPSNSSNYIKKDKILFFEFLSIN